MPQETGAPWLYALDSEIDVGYYTPMLTQSRRFFLFALFSAAPLMACGSSSNVVVPDANVVVRPDAVPAGAPDAAMVGTPDAAAVGTPDAAVVGTPDAAVATPDAAPLTGPVAQFEGQLGQANCAYNVRCGFMSDMALCVSTFYLDDETATLIADVGAGTMTFNSTAAAKYIADYATLPCEDSNSTANFASQADFAATFTSTQATGAHCNFGQECGSGYCASTVQDCAAACCTGSCAAAPAPVADGGDCSAYNVCVSGDHCIEDADQSTFSCRKVGADGAACYGFSDCVDGDQCQVTFTSQGAFSSGKCAKDLASGATCNPLTFDACPNGTYCDSTAKKCTTLVADGGTCDPNQANCVYTDYCNSTTKKCTAPGGASAACVAANDSFDCGGYLVCDSSSLTCTAQTDMTCP